MGRQLRLVTVPGADHERAPDLREAVKSTLAGMKWLADSDGALKALALRQAEEIEKAIDRAELLDELYREAAGDGSIYKKLERLEAMCDLAKTVATIGPQLQATLRDLGGTPAARQALHADKPVGGRLAALRNAASSKD